MTSNTGGVATSASDLMKLQDLPGSRDFILGCYNGHVTVEAGADYRNQICLQSQNSNGVNQASWQLNNWRNCYVQNSSQGCLSAGNCLWINGTSILKDPNTGVPYVYDAPSDQLVPRSDTAAWFTYNWWFYSPQSAGGSTDYRQGGSCVPQYAPGFDVSPSAAASSTSDAVTVCNIPSTNCFVNFTRTAASALANGSWTVDGPVTCLDNNGQLTDATKWMTNFTNLCFSLGDCGVSANYINTSGSTIQSNMFKVYGNISQFNSS